MYIPMYYCQSDHGVSNLLGPRKQGVWSKINFSQIKMLSFVVFKYNGLLNWYSEWCFIPLFFDIEKWLWKYSFGTFWGPRAMSIYKIQQFHLNAVDFWHHKLTLKVQFWHFLMNHNSLTDSKKFPVSMLILGQKSCFLGPTIFKIPQLNWH